MASSSMHHQSFNFPILAAPSGPNITDHDISAYGDYQLQLGDDSTLFFQNRLRNEIAELEWMAKIGTYHGTICAYISTMMLPIAYCSNLPHISPIMTLPFESISITAIIFNAVAALLSYMTIQKARMMPAEFPLRRTYQTPEPSFLPHYVHYFRGRFRNHFALTFFLGTFCVVFQVLLYVRLLRHAQLDVLRAQIAYYTSLLDTAPIRSHRITAVSSISWGLHPLLSYTSSQSHSRAIM